jgi:hypothetical protein
MASLSHDLAGLILPYDHFGSHLNDSGVTINVDLEKINFRKAGQILAEHGIKQSLMVIHVLQNISIHLQHQKMNNNELMSNMSWMIFYDSKSQLIFELIH